MIRVRSIKKYTKKLEEIAEVLREISDIMNNSPEGIVKMITVNVNDSETILTSTSIPTMPWIKMTLFNDGPDPVYPTVNEDTAQKNTPLNDGDQMVVDQKKPLIEKVILICDTGELASVRIKAEK